MATHNEASFVFDVSADELLAILTDPEFIQVRSKAQGALEASYEERERTDDRLVYVVHTVSHARTMTGIDKSKTEKARNIYTWDLKARTGDWEWSGPASDKARVWGRVAVAPEGDKARLISEISIELKIRIPLLGGKIEKMIAKEMEKGQGTYRTIVQDYIDKKKGG
jgi:hypothetical protein